MKRAIILVTVVAAVIGVGTAIIMAQFSEEQQSAGAVSLAGVGAIDLYICEPGPQGETPVPGPDCGPDDDGTIDGPAGQDEAIFETLENLVPGNTTRWDIRMRNVGIHPWNIIGHAVTITETDDPGGDCDAVPTLVFNILGKEGDSVNDNHQGLLPGWIQREGTSTASSNKYQIHVDPNDYEDIRLRFNIPSGIGNECIANAWDITVVWSVASE